MNYQPERWSFFQFVALTQRASGIALVGEQGPARQEALRFRGVASLSFPAGDIHSIEQLSPLGDGEETGSQIRMECTFLSLYGTASPLPTAIAEQVLLTNTEQTGIRDFLDVFNHRLISLLYRCWLRYRLYVGYRRGGVDLGSRRLFALGGIDEPDVQIPPPLRPTQLLPFVGLLRMRTRSARVIAAILHTALGGLPFHIEECVPRQAQVPEWQCSRLGVDNCLLGQDFLLGDRITDHQGMIRVWAGPLTQEQFQRLLPGRESHVQLLALIGFLLTEPLVVGLSLCLLPGAVPPFHLGNRDGAQLGWTTWAGDGNNGSRTLSLEDRSIATAS